MASKTGRRFISKTTQVSYCTARKVGQAEYVFHPQKNDKAVFNAKIYVSCSVSGIQYVHYELGSC